MLVARKISKRVTFLHFMHLTI